MGGGVAMTDDGHTGGRSAADGSQRGTPEESVPRLTVGQLVVDPNLEIELKRLAGEAGLERPLRHPRVQKNGLALAGHFQGVVPTRVQLLGETELSYLDSLRHD